MQTSLTDDDRAALRRLVAELRVAERGSRFGPALWLGDPGGVHVSMADEGTTRDFGGRCDLVHALLAELPEEVVGPAAWLTRSGVPAPHDLDACWLPVVRQVLGEAGVSARFVAVVTRHGWYDPATGESRTWKRLRLR